MTGPADVSMGRCLKPATQVPSVARDGCSASHTCRRARAQEAVCVRAHVLCACVHMCMRVYVCMFVRVRTRLHLVAVQAERLTAMRMMAVLSEHFGEAHKLLSMHTRTMHRRQVHAHIRNGHTHTPACHGSAPSKMCLSACTPSL